MARPPRNHFLVGCHVDTFRTPKGKDQLCQEPTNISIYCVGILIHASIYVYIWYQEASPAIIQATPVALDVQISAGKHASGISFHDDEKSPFHGI